MLDSRTRDAVVSVRNAAEAEGIHATLTVHHEKSHLMRIGNNSVSLNTLEDLTRLDILVTNGRRQATHTHMGTIDGPEIVRRALYTAVEKSKVATPKTYDPIPDRVEETIEESSQFDPALADLDPGLKADAYREIIRRLGQGYNFSGAWSSGLTELFVVTTGSPHTLFHRGTDQLFSVVLKHPEKKWELNHTQTGWRASDFRAEKTVDALGKLLPVYEEHEGFRVEPGDYTVLFGADAVSEIIGTAVWTGLFGRSWEEKQSWTAQQSIGDRILGDNITLTDDPADPLTFMFGFDGTGRRRKRFPLIVKGILSGLMYDGSTAARYGKQPTGHDTNSPSLVVATGSGPACPMEAAKNLGRVLYIPALHYMNIPSRSKGIFTGSSRFNAVLVEDGEVVSPIFSSRITDSFGNVLSNVKVLSSEAESVNGSNTYGRRSPVSMSVPSYIISGGVKITDCAESF
jgi:predicted Zn-dependent protease